MSSSDLFRFVLSYSLALIPSSLRSLFLTPSASLKVFFTSPPRLLINPTFDAFQNVLDIFFSPFADARQMFGFVPSRDQTDVRLSQPAHLAEVIDARRFASTTQFLTTLKSSSASKVSLLKVTCSLGGSREANYKMVEIVLKHLKSSKSVLSASLHF